MKTLEEIKQNDNFLCGVELPDVKIKTYLTYIGGDKVQYHVFFKDELLFDGKDFRPSPMYSQDSLDAIISLLGFIVLKEGDTDKEYFKDYTPNQIEWSKSRECEDLSLSVSDYENETGEYNQQAKDYFKRHFIN